MSVEQNKATVQRWIEMGWNGHDLNMVEEVHAPDFVQHDAGPFPVTSAAAMKQYVGAYLAAFPDLHFTIDDLIAEGDKVVWRWTGTGTQNGPLMGVPASGKHATVTGVVIFRLANNKIVECWVNMDMLQMLQQVGIIPTM